MHYRARAPLRIDFGGGWTDVPLYAQEHGGAVLSAAISPHVEGSIVRPSGGLWAALRHERNSLQYSLAAPEGAGLGASAAQTVLWVTLTQSVIANTMERAQIAETAWRIGGLLGNLGGKQDEYASALGGINYFTFTDTVTAHRLALPTAFQEAFRRRLILVYTGKRRVSGLLHELVWDRYKQGDFQIRQALANLKVIAGAMRDALIAGDLDAFGALLNENWLNQRQLHGSISTPVIDALYTYALQHGAIGGKACGAGGGGCMLFLTRPGEGERLRAAFQQQRLDLIDFNFDTYGVYLQKG